MSKFNNQKISSLKMINDAGGLAYKQDEKNELISILLSSFVEDTFYKTTEQTINRLLELIEKTKDKFFVAKAILYARKIFGMRSITHVAAAKLSQIVKDEIWTKAFYEDVVYRVDDATEILSYLKNNFGKVIPNSLKKGLAKAMTKFDEYQLSKYQSKDKEISLIDLFNLVHPKAKNDEQQEIFKKLMKGELKQHDTWENELSLAGSDEEKKKQVWHKLISENKLGYLALLRNIRNIFEQADNNIYEIALQQLVDENRIKKSLVFPFQIQKAIDIIGNLDRKIIVSLSKALDISVSNVPMLEGKTCVILDESGSMEGKPWEIGSLFGAILYKANDADFILFSADAKYFNPNPVDSVSTIKNSISYGGGGTNLSSAIDLMNKKYDRIIILSDMQTWIECNYASVDAQKQLNIYKQKFNCNPWIYSFDLQNSGTLQFHSNKVLQLFGFSDKIFKVLELLEKNRNALINEIEKVKF